MSMRSLERFAVAALLAAILLIAVDRFMHPHAFLFLPLRHRPPHRWRALEVMLRVRPAFVTGLVLLVAGLLSALVTGCAEFLRLVSGRRA